MQKNPNNIQPYLMMTDFQQDKTLKMINKNIFMSNLSHSFTN